jgi:hypothetical protein
LPIFLLLNAAEVSTIQKMTGFLTVLLCLLPLVISDAGAVGMARFAPEPGVPAARSSAADFVSPEAYQIMYSAMNNKMKTELNPGTTPNFSPNSVSTLTRTDNSGSRRVVARPAPRAASGTVASAVAPSVARSGAVVASPAARVSNSSDRRVVSRANSANSAKSAGAATARAGRGEDSYLYRMNENLANAAAQSTAESLPADRCMADYTDCMNGYCLRKNTAYNRCYCSSRLAQIDATYQPAIDSLIKQMLTLSGTNKWSQKEMNEYWDSIVGVHTGDNSWVKIDEALDINWADTESRVRGQNSFVIGHDYCVQHLRGCFYMANNMRDAYRSDIARDCAVYENSLQKIKNAAESFVESYNE